MPAPLHALPSLVLAALFWIPTASAETVKDREGAVRDDKRKMENHERWLYNDVDAAFAEATKTGKPLLVVLRCVPCLACAGIDGAVTDSTELAPLLEQYVSVRIINANALDLARFQFDYDLSFSAILFNGDGTVYGRFGSWTHQKDPSEKSVAGFKAALEAGLALHAAYPGNRDQLAGKQPVPLPYQTPLDIPLIKNHQNPYRLDLDWQGNVVKSCVHCHQIGDGLKAAYRDRREAIPMPLVYPMPAPETVGLELASDRVARVVSVAPGSSAEKAGFRAGDDLVGMDGDRILSPADIAWKLHHTGGTARIECDIQRSGKAGKLTLELADGWRLKSDISRRVGTWPMRAMVGGGLKLQDLDDKKRARLKVAPDSLALEVIHVGEYGKHAAAKRAGFLVGDILVEVDALSERLSESAYFGTLLQRHPGPASLDAVVLRKGKRVSLKFPMQ